MKSAFKRFFFILIFIIVCSFSPEKSLFIEIVETSRGGHKLSPVVSFSGAFSSAENHSKIALDPKERYQTILGFGGSFTESSAYLLNALSIENRIRILNAYFSKEGANYSLTRTHMNSCDFSLSNYSYAPVEYDKELAHFSVKEDIDDLIPMIKDAQAISEDGFAIIASPWTAPPWMKNNKSWIGGKLLPEYYDTWALFFSKYIDAYKRNGIDIWGLTVENEPHGNGNNWESMHYSPKEMTDFIQCYLGPKLAADGHGDKIILGYDQNRAGLQEWVDELYRDDASSKYLDGVAIHWYESTYDFFPEALQYAHKKAPDKYLIETEGCIDAEVPRWQDDLWYWSKEATDWGWDWAPEKDTYLHPKYAPVHRYARDIIGCLNNWVDGWIDWNMVLDTQGGPNWAENWCAAPVLVDTKKDEVYFTPIYYIMAHFSKYIRPKATIIAVQNTDDSLMVVAAENVDGSIAVVVFNQASLSKRFTLTLEEKVAHISISSQAIQTIFIKNNTY